MAWPFGGQAQAPAAVPFLEDAAGDVKVGLQGNDVADGSSLYAAVDLLALTIVETQDDVTFRIRVSDLRPDNEETGADGASYDIHFDHNGRMFRVFVQRSLPALLDGLFVLIWFRDDPAAEWSGAWQGGLQGTEDTAGNELVVPIPRQALADAQGAVPFPGRTLDNLQVLGRSTFSGSTIDAGVAQPPFPAYVHDLMPEAGAAPASYAIVVGEVQSGSARLFSLAPFRASNGEAATFLYAVMASNIGNADATYTLAVQSVPDPLAVTLPVPILALGPGETRSIPVLVSTPFFHEHGADKEFLLVMQSTSDPQSTGRLRMGIHYLAVPQPAGHHDTLYLHTRQALSFGPLSDVEGYLNTLPEDPDDLGERYYFRNGVSFGSAFAIWRYELSPTLQIGLDVDLNRTGRIQVTIGSLLPLPQLIAQAEVFRGGGPLGSQERAMVAQTEEVSLGDLAPNSEVTFDAPLMGNASADHLAPGLGHNLYLRIVVRYVGSPVVTGVDQESPYLAPGGLLQLPLNEYQDDVDDALADLNGPVLTSVGAQQRLVNPGETSIFKLQVSSPASGDVALELGGVNAAWAQVVPARVRLTASQQAEVTVLVRVPADAADGTRADMVLQAYPLDEPTRRGLLRLVAEVDTDEDHVDESDQAPATNGKETPGWLLPHVMLLLVAIVGARRRRFD